VKNVKSLSDIRTRPATREYREKHPFQEKESFKKFVDMAEKEGTRILLVNIDGSSILSTRAMQALRAAARENDLQIWVGREIKPAKKGQKP
jgi:hypothetical protein